MGVEITSSESTPATIDKSPSAPKRVVGASHPMTPVSSASLPDTKSLTAEEVDKFSQHFEGLLKSADSEYYEFTKVMETLEGPIKDEATRISAAFQTLAIRGLTKEKLLSSAQECIATIEKDKAGFEAAVDSKAEEEIATRKSRLAELDSDIKKASDQINQLTAVIAKSKNEFSQLQTEITETEAKIKRNEGAYQAACESVIGKIKTDIEKAQTKL